MLIYIDNTIAEYLKSNHLDTTQQAFFSSLALSYQRGKCVVFGCLESLEALRRAFGPPIDGIYKAILTKYSENGSVAQWTTIAYIISCQEEGGELSKLPGILEGKAIYLSVEDAAQMNWSLGSCLLAENLSDCEFYETVGKYYAKKNNIRKIQVSFHREQGGGSEISSVLVKCVKTDGIPTLCLSDSDMKFGPTVKYGNPPKGGTYISCARESSRLIKEGFGARFYFPLVSVHEIENLIPYSFLNKLGDGFCSQEAQKLIDELRKIENGSPILFYDFKNGVSIDPSETSGKYWGEVFDRTCFEEGQQQFCSITGPHILDRANKYIAKHGLVSIALDPSLDSYLFDVWNNLGQIIYSWGCASCPMRA